MAENLENKINEHFKRLVPKLAKHLRNDYEKFEYELCSPNIFCASSAYYINLKFWLKEDAERAKNDKNKERTVIMRFFAKTAIVSEVVQRVVKIDIQFHNEIVFYRKYAKNGDRCPKCVYIEKLTPYESTLVLEDVSAQGYSAHPNKIDVPLKDILVAMKEIARFHAKGYIMKEKNPEEFAEVVGEVKDSRFGPIVENDSSYNDHFFYLTNVSLRAVNYLRKINYDRKFCEMAGKLFEDTYHNVMLKAIVPVEPLATLCHGDFTINNVLFKKEEIENDDGYGSRAMLIDFAMLQYASPAIDLSTFLCLSCSKEDRRANFPKIMRTYHEELISCLERAGIENLERFSYKALWNDYVEHGLFGFVIASFFLSILMGKLEMSLEELVDRDIKEVVEINLECGGDEISEILADMLVDFDKLGCLNAFL